MKKYVLAVASLLLLGGTTWGKAPGDNIRKVLQPYIDNGQLPGVVTLIADKDRILSLESMGWADVEGRKRMSEDRMFWIASQSKPIAGAAVMMLVDEGKLDLDEPVTTYVPELADLHVLRLDRDGVRVLEKPRTPITLRHLLSHTSGMQWIAGIQQGMHKIDVLPLRISVFSSALTPLLTEPGERYSYSNQGINMAATIVERVSGMPYEEFLQKRLFDPLGMTSATFWPDKKQRENMALPYRMEDGKLIATIVDQVQYPLDDHARRFAEAAGGLFCKPSDLVKFYQMMAGKGVYNGKRYLSEKAVEQLGTKQTGERVSDPYGLGWVATDWFMGHSGAYGTDTKIYKKRDLVVMYFIQSAGLPKEGEAFARFEEVIRTEYDKHP